MGSRRAGTTAFVCLLAAWSDASCRRPPKAIRVVLITLDTLRYDSFRGAATRASDMPFMQARAAGGLVFERFFSSTSSTQPSHASLFTGVHPWQHGVTRNAQVLGERHRTVAQAFKDAGFHTSAVIASFPLSRRFGFGRGFDQYDESLDRGSPGPVWHVDAAEERYYRLADAVTAAAVAQLDRLAEARQFLWVHYFDPHGPYGDTREGATISPQSVLQAARTGQEVAPLIQRARELYDFDVRHTDAALERLWSRLDRDARRYETHVLVVADHGESFGEDGSMAHGKRITPGQVHVPCFVVSPRVHRGYTRDPAGSIDVPATLYALADIGERAPGGRDLTKDPPADGAAAFGMRRTFVRPHDDVRLDGRLHRLDFNLFYAVGADGHLFTGNGEGMRDAPAGAPVPSPAIERKLKASFRSFEVELTRTVARERTDPETEEALRSLGYVR